MAFRRPWKLAAFVSSFVLAGAVLGCGESPPPPPPPTPSPAPEPEANHKAKARRGRHKMTEEDNMGIAEKRAQRRKAAAVTSG